MHGIRVAENGFAQLYHPTYIYFVRFLVGGRGGGSEQKRQREEVV